ncbi:MAG: Rab family GTPase [Candidatus Hodarchaeota archaeon]
MSSETQNPLLFKISILGDEGIGKDKFINLFAKSQFLEESDAESGVTSYNGKITIDTDEGQQECVIWICNIEGKKRFKTSYSTYLEESHGIMIFFDLTNRKSFDNLPNWIDDIKEERKSKVPILLVGNTEKSKEFVVSPKEINSLIRKFNLYYIETSLTAREGVFDSFYCITSLSLGINVNSKFFLTKDVVYYPSSSLAESIPTTQILSSQDLSNLGHKAIFEKIDRLEEKIKKSMQIELPHYIILAAIFLSISSLILLFIQDSLYILPRNHPGRSYVDLILWTAMGFEIVFVVLIIISYVKRYKI